MLLTVHTMQKKNAILAKCLAKSFSGRNMRFHTPHDSTLTSGIRRFDIGEVRMMFVLPQFRGVLLGVFSHFSPFPKQIALESLHSSLYLLSTTYCQQDAEMHH